MFYKMIFLCDIKFILNTMNTWYVEIIQNQKDTSSITIKHVCSRSIKIQSQPISDLAVFWFELLCRLHDQFVILVNSNVFWILLFEKMFFKILDPDEMDSQIPTWNFKAHVSYKNNIILFQYGKVFDSLPIEVRKMSLIYHIYII